MTKPGDAAQALKVKIEQLDADGRFAEAQVAFAELQQLDAADEAVRKAMAEAGYELTYELALTKRDRAAAEAVYAELGRLLEQFPEDEAVIGNRGASAAALSALCAMEKDWQAACDYATAINHSNSQVPEKLNRELDLLYGRATTTTILALVQEDEWWHARRLAYTLRELLLADFMLSDLAEQRGVELANDIKGLFEAMVDAFREKEPDLAAKIDSEIAEKKGAAVEEPERQERGRVEPQFDFETLKDVTIYGFVSLRVPARWPEARAENGRGGFWEEDVESGTFWIDWDLYSMGGERSRDAAPEIVCVANEGEKAVTYRRSEAFESGEPLVIHNWLVTCGRPGRALLLHFNLVLLADLAAREDFQLLPDLIDREIRAARIDVSRIPSGAD